MQQLRAVEAVSSLVEHAGDDQRRPGAVAYLTRTDLDPGLARPRQRRVGSGRWQSGNGAALDQAGHFGDGCGQITHGPRALKPHVGCAKLPDLPLRPRGEFDQRRLWAMVCPGCPASLAPSCSTFVSWPPLRSGWTPDFKQLDTLNPLAGLTLGRHHGSVGGKVTSGMAAEAKLIDAAVTGPAPHYERYGWLHWPEHP